MSQPKTKNSEEVEMAYRLGQQASENWEEEQLRESDYYQEDVLKLFREKCGYLDLEDIDMEYSCPPDGEAIYLLKDMKEKFWEGFRE